RAAGADDILARARVHETLDAALAGVRTVYGTTARTRHIDWPAQTPREAAADIAASDDEVAIVFGRERSGLTNEELDRCQRAIHIPTSAEFRSLNLAQAVQICAYEVALAGAARPAQPAIARGADDPPASAAELEGLRAHCLAVMAAVGYYDPARPKLLERRLQRLFNRAGLLHSESQILRGFFAAIEQRLPRDE
ncbi:MAG: TrmH family RNA methyltransferase, partial [Gammaproteobacteria bacterium]